MQNIDGTLYGTSKIYRDIVDEMIAAENKRVKTQTEIEKQIVLRQVEQARRQAEMNVLRRRLHSYTNQYITPSYQAQHESYLSTPVWKPSADPRAYSEQQRSTHYALHLAVSAAAYISKRQSPVASVILDSFGLMTSDNFLDAAKSAVSAADTICNIILPDVKGSGTYAESKASHQLEELAES